MVSVIFTIQESFDGEVERLHPPVGFARAEALVRAGLEIDVLYHFRQKWQNWHINFSQTLISELSRLAARNTLPHHAH